MKFESIRYSGSKYKIIPKINEIVADLPIKKAVDAFSGSTRVAQYFKSAEIKTVLSPTYFLLIKFRLLAKGRTYCGFSPVASHLFVVLALLTPN